MNVEQLRQVLTDKNTVREFQRRIVLGLIAVLCIHIINDLQDVRAFILKFNLFPSYSNRLDCESGLSIEERPTKHQQESGFTSQITWYVRWLSSLERTPTFFSSTCMASEIEHTAVK